MKIAVIGVGGYFGGKLTQLLPNDPDLEIYFVARNEHLEEIKRNGLILDTEEGQSVCRPTFATDDISELPALDLCIIAVKSYDLNGVLRGLSANVSDSTIILPLLNGVDIYERIRSVIAKGTVLPSCVYVGTHVERPGKVVQRGGACNIVFGKDPKHDSDLTVMTDLMKKANIRFSMPNDPYVEIWGKFVFIASFGLVTANYDRTIGEVLRSEELSSQVKNIMKEIVDIALGKHILLPTSTIDDSFAKARSFPYGTKTSFQRDYENPCKKDERDLFGGAIVRMSEELQMKAEATRTVYDSLQRRKAI